ERSWPVDHHQLYLLHRFDAAARDVVSGKLPAAPCRYRAPRDWAVAHARCAQVCRPVQLLVPAFTLAALAGTRCSRPQSAVRAGGLRAHSGSLGGEINMPNNYIKLDPATFDPWKVQPITHTLADHPLLRIEALAELGRRLESRKQVRTHNTDATAGTVFANAPDLHPNTRPAEETLSQIAQAKAWISLLFVHTDEIYHQLVEDIFTGLNAVVERRDPGMSHRGAWIFVSSPKAVTPYHIDHVHTFILQILGRKKYYTWDPFDRVVVPEKVLEDFHGHYSRDRVTWDESFRARATPYDLEPGKGVYTPSTTPHMVENGDGPSITVSIS